MKLGEVIFGILKLGELGEVSIGMLKLGKLGEVSFRMSKRYPRKSSTNFT